MKALLCGLGILIASFAARADGFEGEKKIYLGDASGSRLYIRHVNFTPVSHDHWKFGLVLDSR